MRDKYPIFRLEKGPQPRPIPGADRWVLTEEEWLRLDLEAHERPTSQRDAFLRYDPILWKVNDCDSVYHRRLETTGRHGRFITTPDLLWRYVPAWAADALSAWAADTNTFGAAPGRAHWCSLNARLGPPRIFDGLCWMLRLHPTELLNVLCINERYASDSGAAVRRIRARVQASMPRPDINNGEGRQAYTFTYYRPYGE